MRRLRDKLGAAAKHLDTVRGVGYRFVEVAS
jgi:DNA-binding response OmpR family regulator